LRDLVEISSDHDWRPGLSLALGSLGLPYARLGRTEQSIATTEEAVEIRRALAAASPAEHDSALQELLLQRAEVLRDAGRRLEYLQTIQEVNSIGQRMRIEGFGTTRRSPAP